MKTATVSLWSDKDIAHATKAILSPYADHMTGRVAVIPSSMDPADPFAKLVEEGLPESVTSFPAIPVSGAAARRAFITPVVLGQWIDRPVRASGVAVSAIALPRDIAQAQHRIIVVDVVEVSCHGPFVLDLPARFIHPRQRMRLLSSGQREALAAEVGSAFAYDLMAVYLASRDGAVLAVTSDPIAAELTALAMSELCLGSPRSFTGPWEDPVVQRATELEMGVLLPSHIRLVTDGPHQHEAWSQRVVEHIRIRLGIPEAAGR